eukprot:169049-Prorocentrum_minimum.AAC.1
MCCTYTLGASARLLRSTYEAQSSEAQCYRSAVLRAGNGFVLLLVAAHHGLQVVLRVPVAVEDDG